MIQRADRHSICAGEAARQRFLPDQYNVVNRTSETRIVTGYTQNVIGFGWTNGVFLELLSESPPSVL
jgi:neutral trehalase